MTDRTDRLAEIQILDQLRNAAKAEQLKRNTYWSALRNARADFIENFQHGYYEPSDGALKRWLEETYGVGIIYHDGNITSDYNILDEHKHLMFILKYCAK